MKPIYTMPLHSFNRYLIRTPNNLLNLSRQSMFFKQVHQYLPLRTAPLSHNFQKLRMYTTAPAPSNDQGETPRTECTEQKKGSSSEDSENFRNYTSGIAQIITSLVGAGGLYVAKISTSHGNQMTEDAKELREKLDEEREKYRKASETMERIGLVDVQNYAARTLEKQAEEFSKTKERITVVGISGTRLLEPNMQLAANPVSEAIKELLRKKVEVRLMIYSKDIFNGSTEEKDKKRVKKIQASIEHAQKLNKDFGDRFQCKLLKSEPPFHAGSLQSQGSYSCQTGKRTKRIG